MSAKSSAIPIAVVGMSAIYPGEPGLAGFWKTIMSGRDAIRDVPPSHWLIDDYFDADPSAPDKTYCRRGGFIEPVPFDPMQFGLPPTALPSTDSAQLLALVAAKQALDQASRGHAKVDPDRISVVLGVASTTELVVQMGARLQRPIWRKAMLENGLDEAEADEICRDIAANYAPWQESTFPGLLGNVVAGRIANRLNLGGSNYVTDAACASSLSALQVALHELYLDEADMVLTGGVDALNDIMMFMCFSKTPAFSPTGDCRPFSEAADGTIIGEGVGMLALKRLSDAERDGDPIHAVIRGLGSSSDGRASSVYAPRSEGQAKALRRAYERAGYGPETVSLLEAHGTATKAGDAAEFAGLASVFPAAEKGVRCALGSVKSQIGHTKAAAGAAGLIKTVLALQHGVLPGTAKVSSPNPALGLEKTGFYINSGSRPWISRGDATRRAAVSSFGFGGSNFHVTLEEYRGSHRAKRLRVLPSELVLLSAASASDLAARCAALLATARRGETLARIAHECSTEFDAGSHIRVGLVASDIDELVKQLERLSASCARGEPVSASDANMSIGVGPARNGKTAFLFPGQGSQYVGMGADLARTFPEALAVWDGLPDDCRDVGSITHPEPVFTERDRAAQAAVLTEMANAQPAIAAMSLSQLVLLERLGITPDVAGGHSFGEVVALAAAGAFSKDQLVSAARIRGALMTEAAKGRAGAMLALACSAGEFETLFGKDVGLRNALVVANDNAPGQIVLSGLASDIARAEALAKDARVTAFRLPVASAFHSPIVAESCAPFEAYLKTLDLSQPAFSVYANTTARPYTRGIARQLAQQLGKPVRFREMVEAMSAAGVTRFIEVGPGRVLTGLVGQILEGTAHIAVALDDKKAGDLRAWHRGLAALAADGVALNCATLFESYETPAAHSEAPAHAVMVGGANLGKPYPPADGEPRIVVKDRPLRMSATASAPSTLPAPGLSPESSNSPRAIVPASSKSHGQMTQVDDVWGLVDRIQEETAEQHRLYLETMAQSHQAFLDASSQMLGHIMGATTPINDISSFGAHAPPVPRISDVPAPLSLSPPSPLAPVVATPPSRMSAPSETNVARPQVEPEAILLKIVSEKTGYPIDMLGLDMEMEAELGIDSIKQVEILSAMQTQFPEAPEIAASELSKLRTLRDVAETIGVFVTNAPSASVHTATAGQSAVPDFATVSASVLAVVGEKTGYPVDMLGLDMELEAELGIDSIKQVEILSALQERWPEAPEVPASELSRIKKLRDVVDVLCADASRAPVVEQERSVVSARVSKASTGLQFTTRTFEPTPAPGFAMAGLRDAEIVVTNEEPGLSTRIVEALQQRGVRARSGVPEAGDTAVISLAGFLRASNAAELNALHLRALAAMRVVARSDASPPFFVAVQPSEEGSGLALGLSGMLRSAAREWQCASVKLIQIEKDDAQSIVAELFEGGGDAEVRLHANGDRQATCDKTADYPRSHIIDLPRDGVVVVSGGARGVTADCALALAKQHGLRLALLGRTAPGDPVPLAEGGSEAEIAAALVAGARASGETLTLPEARRRAGEELARREIRLTLDKARERGIQASYVEVDVADAVGVMSAIDKIRKDGALIVGIIHGAGVLADKRIEDLGEAAFAKVFLTKVAGAETLLEATKKDALRFIAFFSSVSATAGNSGQCAYAAANAVLNGIARREAKARGENCAVHAFGWGPWDGGMVDETLKRRFESVGVEVIPRAVGAEVFASHAVSTGGLPDFVVTAPALKALVAARLEWEIDPLSLPLTDHSVRGRMVLPVVLVLERILRAVQSLSDRASGVVVEDLQVLSGVTWSAKDSGSPVKLLMSIEPSGSDAHVTLRDESNRPRYRATVRLEHVVAETGSFDGETVGWPMQLAEAYAGPLFHGPRFAALDRLEGYAETGGSATLRTTQALGWKTEPWVIDPAALDGGLQLGLLWASLHERPLMLPQRIGKFVLLDAFGATTPMRCRFRAHSVSDKRVDFDFLFEGADGAPVAFLQGGEYYAVGSVVTATP